MHSALKVGSNNAGMCSEPHRYDTYDPNVSTTVLAGISLGQYRGNSSALVEVSISGIAAPQSGAISWVR